jgi:hypothetical protein
MAKRNPLPSASVAERVDHAIARSNGRLRLWVVFDAEEDARAARALIAAAKARHLEALSRAEWESREAAAMAGVLARSAAPATEPAPVAPAPAPVPPAEPAASGRRRRPAPQAAAPAPKAAAAPRRRASA